MSESMEYKVSFSEISDMYEVYKGEELSACECVDEADAKKIANALNAHDDLVAALKEAKSEIGFLYQGGMRTIELIDKIDAALAKAEGTDA